MNNVYFDNVKHIGKLYLEYVFFEFESEPILFSCIDEKKNLYLCLCADIRYGQRWIIAKCSTGTLRRLIEEKIDIASAFLAVPSVVVIVLDLQGNESSSVINVDQIDRLDLPKEGTYIRCDKDKAKDYLLRKEAEAFSVQVVVAPSTASIIQRVMSYYVLIKEEINMGSKQEEAYGNLANKEFIEQSDNLFETQGWSLSKDIKYSIHVKGRNVEIMDNDLYTQAA